MTLKMPENVEREMNQMLKKFNITGYCNPNKHYMVDLTERLNKIKAMVDEGEYFVINRARQYGKTTTIMALRQFLENDYIVVSMDFQRQMSTRKFQDETTFSLAFAEGFLKKLNISDAEQQMEEKMNELKEISQQSPSNFDLVKLFDSLSAICDVASKPIVLIIDEVDSASNNQVFLDFLAQLRGGYIERDEQSTFHSVILAGVYDIKNIRQKIRPDDQHKTNSPWNIAADFNIDMSLSVEGIIGMLMDYEQDHRTGMNVQKIAQLLYDYTSGYPFLVSRLCRLIDENLCGWTKQGVLDALRMLYNESNPLFESLLHRLEEYPELEKLLRILLFNGQPILYNPLNSSIQTAVMFGFVKNDGGSAVVANRVFSTVMYNYFLSTAESQETAAYTFGTQNKLQFIKDGHLDMTLVIEKFIQHFSEIFNNKHESFIEEEGRRYFLLYLRPIINGTGNYYIESRTLDNRRTDIIIDYKGEQFIVELKIWRGNAYNQEGEKQLADYLDSYGLKKGYMLTFSFNKEKVIGVKQVKFEDKILIEAVV